MTSMNNDQLKKVAIEALETCAIGANGFTKTYWFDEQKVKAAIAALTAAQSAPAPQAQQEAGKDAQDAARYRKLRDPLNIRCEAWVDSVTLCESKLDAAVDAIPTASPAQAQQEAGKDESAYLAKEQEQEPVATVKSWNPSHTYGLEISTPLPVGTKLYAAPQAQQEAQEALTLLANLAAVVRVQNGNRNEDINALLAHADRILEASTAQADKVQVKATDFFSGKAAIYPREMNLPDEWNEQADTQQRKGSEE